MSILRFQPSFSILLSDAIRTSLIKLHEDCREEDKNYWQKFYQIYLANRRKLGEDLPKFNNVEQFKDAFAKDILNESAFRKNIRNWSQKLNNIGLSAYFGGIVAFGIGMLLMAIPGVNIGIAIATTIAVLGGLFTAVYTYFKNPTSYLESGSSLVKNMISNDCKVDNTVNQHIELKNEKLSGKYKRLSPAPSSNTQAEVELVRIPNKNKTVYFKDNLQTQKNINTNNCLEAYETDKISY